MTLLALLGNYNDNIRGAPFTTFRLPQSNLPAHDPVLVSFRMLCYTKQMCSLSLSLSLSYTHIRTQEHRYITATPIHSHIKDFDLKERRCFGQPSRKE